MIIKYINRKKYALCTNLNGNMYWVRKRCLDKNVLYEPDAPVRNYRCCYDDIVHEPYYEIIKADVAYKSADQKEVVYIYWFDDGCSYEPDDCYDDEDQTAIRIWNER